MSRDVRLLRTPAEMRLQADRWRAAGLSVGLVPTMGALHDGHRSLVRRARGECDRVVASIFVNPTQFGPGEDLSRYPRTLERDLDILREEGADAAFVPAVEAMYPEGAVTTVSLRVRSPKASRAGPVPGTSTAWPRWWPSCSPRPGPTPPTSARRTPSRSG